MRPCFLRTGVADMFSKLRPAPRSCNPLAVEQPTTRSRFGHSPLAAFRHQQPTTRSRFGHSPLAAFRHDAGVGSCRVGVGC